jgi:hypothetical protein
MATETPTDSDRPAFRVALTLTDTEIATFQRIVAARQRKGGVVTRVLAMVLMSFVAAWLGGWLMARAGIVQSGDWGLAAMLVFLTYWLSFLIAVLLAGAQTRENLRRARADMRRRLTDATMLANRRGILVRLADGSFFYRRSMITSASLERGLVMLWASLDAARPILCVPVRLLEPGQQTQLLSLRLRPMGRSGRD